jgi:hypothetical protein
VVVNDLDVMRIPLPAEAHTPLLVDANAVLPGSLALQLLQAIARWDAEIVELLRGVDSNELSQHHTPEAGWKRPHWMAPKQPLHAAVGKALYHLK